MIPQSHQTSNQPCLQPERPNFWLSGRVTELPRPAVLAAHFTGAADAALLSNETSDNALMRGMPLAVATVFRLAAFSDCILIGTAPDFPVLGAWVSLKAWWDSGPSWHCVTEKHDYGRAGMGAGEKNWH
jgi:hypothetical protein